MNRYGACTILPIVDRGKEAGRRKADRVIKLCGCMWASVIGQWKHRTVVDDSLTHMGDDRQTLVGALCMLFTTSNEMANAASAHCS
jgi:hypothetical protein